MSNRILLTTGLMVLFFTESFQPSPTAEAEATIKTAPINEATEYPNQAAVQPKQKFLRSKKAVGSLALLLTVALAIITYKIIVRKASPESNTPQNTPVSTVSNSDDTESNGTTIPSSNNPPGGDTPEITTNFAQEPDPEFQTDKDIEIEIESPELWEAEELTSILETLNQIKMNQKELEKALKTFAGPENEYALKKITLDQVNNLFKKSSPVKKQEAIDLLKNSNQVKEVLNRFSTLSNTIVISTKETSHPTTDQNKIMWLLHQLFKKEQPL